MHWLTGAQWGALYGLVAGRRGHGPLAGLVLGSLAWATAYSLLPAAGFYQPPWEYDLGTLAKDLGGHLVFGVTAVAAFGLLRHA